jgi:hypothetical protein
VDPNGEDRMTINADVSLVAVSILLLIWASSAEIGRRDALRLLNFYTRQRPRRIVRIQIANIFKKEHHRMSTQQPFQLPDDDYAVFPIMGVDDTGTVVAIPSNYKLSATTSDPTVVGVGVDSGNLYVVAAGKIGSASVAVSADPGGSGGILTAQLLVQTIAGGLASIELGTGIISHNPPPTPAPAVAAAVSPKTTVATSLSQDAQNLIARLRA